MANKDIYQEITNQIISDLEKGFMGFPTNVFSKSFYSGINTLILWLRQSKIGFETSQWITFLQVKKLGGSIKKGERATQIVFYKKLIITDKESEEEKTIPLLKTHAVFNLSQTKGLEHLIKKSSSKEEPLFQDVEKAEQFIKKSKADISFALIDKACYLPEEDKILIPKKEQFKTQEGFYSTMFHELSHWTAHKSRLPYYRKQ